MSGLRTATFNVIATATLAAEIASGGLGQFISTGLEVNDSVEIVCGAILVVGPRPGRRGRARRACSAPPSPPRSVSTAAPVAPSTHWRILTCDCLRPTGLTAPPSSASPACRVALTAGRVQQ